MVDTFTRVEFLLAFIAVAAAAHPYALVFASIYERRANNRILSARRLAYSLVLSSACYLAASLLALEVGFDLTSPNITLTAALLGGSILLPPVIVRHMVLTERGRLPFSHAFAAFFFLAIILQIGSNLIRGILGGW